LRYNNTMKNVEEFKKQLENEKRELEKTLGSIGHKTKVGGKEDWVPSYPDLNPMQSDKSEMADEVEEFENRIGIEGKLEERLDDIHAALKRIEDGTYGICEEGGEQIEPERLRANPAARTCIQHA